MPERMLREVSDERELAHRMITIIEDIVENSYGEGERTVQQELLKKLHSRRGSPDLLTNQLLADPDPSLRSSPEYIFAELRMRALERATDEQCLELLHLVEEAANHRFIRTENELGPVVCYLKGRTHCLRKASASQGHGEEAGANEADSSKQKSQPSLEIV